MRGPALRVHPYLEFGGPIPFAHRGGAADAPENTMRAFSRAVAEGYLYLETDVQATADGVLLAFHDDTLDRVTDKRGTIAKMPYTDVSNARVHGLEPIPRLEEVLAAWPDVRVNIDVKSDAAVEPLIKLLTEQDCLERVCVGSFNPWRLWKLRRAFGRALCTSLTVDEVARLRIASYGFPAGPIFGNCAQVPETQTIRNRTIPIVDDKFLRAAHARHIPVHVWTVDERADMERLLDLGVDGLITDRPALLKEVLDERALWGAPPH